MRWLREHAEEVFTRAVLAECAKAIAGTQAQSRALRDRLRGLGWITMTGLGPGARYRLSEAAPT